MKALALTCATALLAGCVSTSHAPVQTTAAAPTLCKHSITETERVFIICPAGTKPDSAGDALKRPADPTLDLASLARSYGTTRQRVIGIHPATYAAITGRTTEQRSRTANEVVIEGRTFRATTLTTPNRAPVTVFVES